MVTSCIVTVHIPPGSHAPSWEPYFCQSRVNSRSQGATEYVPTPVHGNEIGRGVNVYLTIIPRDDFAMTPESLTRNKYCEKQIFVVWNYREGMKG